MKELKRQRHDSSSSHTNDYVDYNASIPIDDVHGGTGGKKSNSKYDSRRNCDHLDNKEKEVMMDSTSTSDRHYGEVHKEKSEICSSSKKSKSNYRSKKSVVDLNKEVSNRTKLSGNTVENTQLYLDKQPCSYEISDIDHENAVRLLRLVDWNKIQNISRQNVIRKGDRNTPKNNSGKEYCHSFIFGKNMKDSEGKLSFWSTQCPELYQLFQSLIHKVHPEHSFTNITVNKNLSCKRHTDGGNTGLSYIISFGHFTGGRLLLEQVGGGKPRAVDIYRKFVAFEGSKQPHETEEFYGERYSAVFYTSSIQPTEITPRQRVNSNDVDSGFKMKFDAIKKKLTNKMK